MSAESLAVRYERFDRLQQLLPVIEACWRGGPREQAEYQRLTSADRRVTWQWGRVLSRLMLQECGIGVDAAEADGVEILSRNAQGQSDRPCVWRNGAVWPVRLSISHSSRGVAVAVSGTDMVGIDLVDLQQVPPGTLWVWMTDAERAWVRQDDHVQQATVWAIKEAVYKAVQTGESFAPRRISVARAVDGYTCQYAGRGADEACEIQVSEVDGHVLAVARRR